MTYAIIGSGNVGMALARLFHRKGIQASIANTRGPGSIAQFVQEFGSTIQEKTLKDALAADIIFLAIPFTKVKDFASSLSDWNGKIVVDATNAHGVAPELLDGHASSELVSSWFPGATVVKAFNQLPAAVLARDPLQDGGRRVVFVASNDESAAATIAALAKDLGFAPIQLGRIDEGGRLAQIPGPLVLHNFVEYPLK